MQLRHLAMIETGPETRGFELGLALSLTLALLACRPLLACQYNARFLSPSYNINNTITTRQW